MENNIQLVKFVDNVNAKIGVNLAIFSEDGNFIYGKADKNETVPVGFTNVYLDIINDRTLFFITVNGNKYVAKISGSKKAELNYALLIGELALGLEEKEVELTKDEFYTELLNGQLKADVIKQYAEKYNVTDSPCFCMLVKSEKGEITEDVINVMLNYLNDSSDYFLKLDTGFVFIKYLSERQEEYPSIEEFVDYLVSSVLEENGTKISVYLGGMVKGIFDLSTSYAQAKSVYRICKKIKFEGSVHSFKEYSLVKMLEDLPKYRLSEYLETLLGGMASGSLFLDEEMTNTAEAFLESGLNVSETSRSLFLHRNTLMYRLDKIEKQTGLNIKKFSDAIVFRLIMILTKLVK